VPGIDEAGLLGRLRAGDEDAFVDLIQRHHQAMVRVARSYVPSQAVAEEVVQETWLAALRGLPCFEGRSSVKTWLYRILLNRARSAGVKEHRQIPVEDPERAVDGRRFDRGGSWSQSPAHWADDVDDRVRAERLTKSIRIAIDELPSVQRDVVTFRDVQGMTAAEACEILGLSEGHQRVLLHRARSRLRNALEAEFGEVGA
jgi:RNA polymerase sigma-70 factor (ECF subfamily)